MFTTLIDVPSLDCLIGEGNLVLFDCSFELSDPSAGLARYLSGHLPNAHYLHLEKQLSGLPDGTNGRHPLPDRSVLANILRAAGLSNDQQVVVYDDSDGAYAARLWWLVRWLGHSAVAVLDGGKRTWTAYGMLIETGMPSSIKGNFQPSVYSGQAVVDANSVLANIEDGDSFILDARSPERFRGDTNPIDPVPGHIPGARNRFFKDNLTPEGQFKDAAGLRAEFAALIGEKKPADIVLQCGSGVTACHNALAMEIAGLGGAALYPGSWSEWISDRRRPIAKKTG